MREPQRAPYVHGAFVAASLMLPLWLAVLGWIVSPWLSLAGAVCFTLAIIFIASLPEGRE